MKDDHNGSHETTRDILLGTCKFIIISSFQHWLLHEAFLEVAIVDGSLRNFFLWN